MKRSKADMANGKKKAGRKPLPEAQKLGSAWPVRVRPDLRQAMIDYCQRRQMPVAEFVRRALREALLRAAAEL